MNKILTAVVFVHQEKENYHKVMLETWKARTDYHFKII